MDWAIWTSAQFFTATSGGLTAKMHIAKKMHKSTTAGNAGGQDSLKLTAQLCMRLLCYKLREST